MRNFFRGITRRSILALLTGLIAISVTGFAMTTHMFFGVEWVEEVHELAVNGTLVLAALHVAGVLFSSLAHGENLIKSMITGRKRTDNLH